jgi:hypothetical protein
MGVSVSGQFHPESMVRRVPIVDVSHPKGSPHATVPNVRYARYLQVCLGKSTLEALPGGVYSPDLFQFCLKSYRLAAANCEIMRVARAQ